MPKVLKATTGHIEIDAKSGSAEATYAHRLIGTDSIFILYKYIGTDLWLLLCF